MPTLFARFNTIVTATGALWDNFSGGWGLEAELMNNVMEKVLRCR